MVPIVFSYATYYRLPMVTFILGRSTHRLATIHTLQTTDDKRQTDARL